MYFAVGILFFLQIDFIKAFEPSSLAAYLFGPNTLILCLVKKSTIPLTKGSSGPTITKSILLDLIIFNIFGKLRISSLIFLAILLVPAFPGIQNIFFDNFELRIFWHKACSLPPLPIKAIFI